MSKRTLEQYRVFPFIAWTLVLGFTIFVYNLTTKLNSYQNNLADHTINLEDVSKTDPLQIDFTDKH